MRKILRTIFYCVLGAVVCAHAQIRVGLTSGITGPVAAGVKENMDGAKLYIDSINAKGGIKGEVIEIVSLDDKFDVKLAAQNAQDLITKHHVVALFLNRGTPHTEAILPLLSEHKIALIAPSTGAAILHQPVNPFVFNVRSAYQKEAEKAISHLRTLGIARMAVIHADDSFGKDALEGAQRSFARENVQPVAVLKADRSKPDYATLVPAIVKADAQAVLWVGSATAVADGVKALRAAGSVAQVLTLSNNASSGFIKSLGDSSHGVIVSQVFPGERAVGFPIVREAQELSKAQQLTLSPAMLEGFAAAKVLVEGLRRAAPGITREKLRSALESIKGFDLGGIQVSYSSTSHTGLDYVELSIISREGKFIR